MALHVISVGGSLIVPEEIDTDFLAIFKQFIIKRIEKGDRFILVAGGGKTARKYQSAAALVKRLEFHAFPPVSRHMLILLRGVYICNYICKAQFKSKAYELVCNMQRPLTH